MAKSRKRSILKTDKRITLGIWGLGRGLSFLKTCNALQFDVVAGCDFNEHMRRRFAGMQPDALVTDDAEVFLNAGFEAVLLATYCPAHAEHAIQCLDAGKHVLSEVTAFHTMAEGVRLVEAVERSGLVYNLAENYPFTKPMLYLADKWRRGLFGDLMYAECEYVHECRELVYTYIDRVPVQPGWRPHNWRSWQHYHYYNTHSLGPVMHITQTRPTRVVTLPGERRLAGYLMTDPKQGMGGAAPSLITMSNGGLMRNLMGATTNDSHIQRFWGTRGAAEWNRGLFLRLGGSGGSPKLEVEPGWPMLAEYADTMGHGGSDFWMLYYFARHILFGEPAFFDIYNAADCTIPGILAFRSALEGGRAFDVPDFRNKAERVKHRRDHFAQQRYDVEKGCFPRRADKKLVGRFTSVMKDTIHASLLCRATADWLAVADDVKDPREVAHIADEFLGNLAQTRRTFAAARKLIRAYPRSDGARVLREMLELADAARVTRRGFVDRVRKARSRLKRARGKR